MTEYQFILVLCIAASIIAADVAAGRAHNEAFQNVAIGWGVVNVLLFMGALYISYGWVRLGSLSIIGGLLVACMCFRPTVQKIRMLLAAPR